MNDQKCSLNDFITKFNDKLIEKIRINMCRFCLGKTGRLGNTFIVRCSKKNCRKYDYILKNKIFAKNNVEFEVKLKIIYMWSQNIKKKNICEILNISKTTVNRVLYLFYQILERNKDLFCFKIGGENLIVEIDESKFGKRKYNRGHSVDGVWVLGFVERSPARRIILVPVDVRNANTLTELIKTYVQKKSILYTDCWKGYSKVKEFYLHFTVNHSIEFVNNENGVHTNTIEGNWGAIKKTVPNRCKSKTKINPYLNLFMLKRNLRNYFDSIINMLIN